MVKNIFDISSLDFGAISEVICPATIANLVCGFDVLGMAVEQPFDRIRISLIEKPEVRIKHFDEFDLPEDPELNVAGVVLLDIMVKCGGVFGFEVEIEKQIKPGSGIGSSAASAAGAAVAANNVLGKIFSSEQLIQFAMMGEKLASGVKHADNIAPCIMGGVTLIRAIHPLDIVSLPPPKLFVTIVHPLIEVRTSDARQILKDRILLKDAVKQWGNIGALVAGFLKNDIHLIGRSLEDHIIEPVRSILIPGFNEIRSGCRDVGAIGGGICGSGPSVFMFSENEKIARDAEFVMKTVYEKIGVDYNTYVTTVNETGISEMNSQ